MGVLEASFQAFKYLPFWIDVAPSEKRNFVSDVDGDSISAANGTSFESRSSNLRPCCHRREEQGYLSVENKGYLSVVENKDTAPSSTTRIPLRRRQQGYRSVVDNKDTLVTAMAQ